MITVSPPAVTLSPEALPGVDAFARPPRLAPDSVACWEVDVAPVRALIDTIADGGEWPDWAAALLHGARIVDVSERGLQLVGSPVAREIMIGQPVACFCPPESWTILAKLIAAVAADRPDHAARSSGISSFLLKDALLTVWGTAGDGASDRVWVAVDGEIADDRSVWAVRASEQRYRRLIHHLPGALLQADARAMGAVFYRLRSEGVTDIALYLADHGELVDDARRLVRVTDANRGAAMLLGATGAEELIGPVDYLFAAAPDTARRVMIAHFEGRRSHAELMELRTFDGRLLNVQLTVTFPTPPERLDVTLISLEDVTDKLRTESQFRQLQADHSRAARIATLGELASSIAHEVNQPLAAIAMNAETSLRWLTRDPPNLAKVSELTARIAESARHASRIVQRIRGMAGRHVPERVPLDLNAVIDEALLFVRHDLDARAISLIGDFRPGLPPVLGDRVQLQQVIVNLLVNAIQALAQSGVRGGRIEVASRRDESGAILLSVRDNGPGIAGEDLDRVFEGFFTTKSDGMGIGLAVCHSIIVAHGGRIDAANHEDGGALFRVALPPAPQN